MNKHDRTQLAVAAEAEPEKEVNPYEPEAFKTQLQQVSDLYEEMSRFPVTSLPITNPRAVREREPFEFNEVELPFSKPNKDNNSIRISAATNTY